MENPKTGRQIKVGAATWKKLVREEILTGNDAIYYDDKELLDYSGKGEENLDLIRAQLRSQIDTGKYDVARGQGRHKGKFVKKARRLRAKRIPLNHSTAQLLREQAG